MKLFSDRPFYKGNLHLHTTHSDGHLSPEEAIVTYQQAGYDFLAVTDHWHLFDGASHYKNMLLLPGVELDFTLPTQVIHLVCLGIDAAVMADIDRSGTAQQAIDAVTGAGGRVILAHPAWSLNTLDVIASLKPLVAAEIYNTLSGTPWNAERGNSSGILDVAAANGCVLNLVASDDSHFYTGEQCQAAIMLQADELTRDSLLEALAEGRFYATTGPRFRQIEYTGGQITVDCDPVEKIIFYSNLFWVADRCHAGQDLTEAEHSVRSGERFVRVEIVDAEGRSAWSNPILI